MKRQQKLKFLALLDDPEKMKKIKTPAMVAPEDRDHVPTAPRVARAATITPAQLRLQRQRDEEWARLFPMPQFESEDA